MAVRVIAVLLFLAGLLLAVRVMFFGVQRRRRDEQLAHRRWPLTLAAFLAVAGAMLYARRAVTPAWIATVVVTGLVLGAGAWWLVSRSARAPSNDPEDDPRYRFQGHVARVIEPLRPRADGPAIGRIAFEFDGKRYEFRAAWTVEWEQKRPGEPDGTALAVADGEVVIEHIDDDLAYVEPWTAVESRL